MTVTTKSTIIIPVLLVMFLGAISSCKKVRGSGEQDFTVRAGGCAESVDSNVYVMGGFNLSQNLTAVGAYNPLNKTWTPKAAIPTPRGSAASAILGKEIYVVGGRDEKGILSTVEKYATTEDKWQRCSPMPTARWSLMLCASGGKLYAFGGITGTGNNRQAIDAIEIYDPNTDSWQLVGKMPQARQSATVAVVNDMIYIISGKVWTWAENNRISPITNRVDCFDPKTKKWSQVKDIPTGRAGAKAIVANGLVFVVGGVTKDDNLPTQIDIFDPVSNEWTTGPQLSQGRSGHTCALVDNEIVVFGGTTIARQARISGAIETVSISGYPKK